MRKVGCGGDEFRKVSYGLLLALQGKRVSSHSSPGMEMAGKDVVRVDRKDEIVMADCSGHEISVHMPCLVDCFHVELVGTELDDSISSGADERVAVKSLVDVEEDGLPLHEEFCVSETIGCGAAFRCEAWFAGFLLLERGGDFFIEELFDQRVLMFFPATW